MIPEAEIASLKVSVDLAALVRSRGIRLTPKGKDLVALCPLHSDSSPSLIITPSTNLFHCFSCGAGGDAIEFVMRYAKVSFPDAVRILADGRPNGTAAHARPVSSIVDVSHNVLLSPENQRVAKLVMDQYAKNLKNSPAAQEYLMTRGISGPELPNFKIGYADGNLPRLLPQGSPEGDETLSLLKATGLITARGSEFFASRIVIGITDTNGTIIQMYGRSITKHLTRSDHLYLTAHTGVFNPRALVSDTVILTESPIDALSFIVSGIPNVTCTYGSAFSGKIAGILRDHGVRRVLIAFDADAPGERLADKIKEDLKSHGIESSRITFPPGMDPNDVLVKFGADALREAIKMANIQAGEHTHVEQSPAAVPAPLRDRIGYTFADRTYRIDGFAKNRSPGSLSVTIHAEKSGTLFPEKVELYLAKDRERFVRLAAKELEIEEETIKGDLNRMLPDLRSRQDQMIEDLLAPSRDHQVKTISAIERSEAFDRILKTQDPLAAFALCLEEDGGIVGERLNIEASILASVSRLLSEPLHVIYQAPSAAGKSTIMKAILDSIPDESKHVFTEVSPNAFFYFEEGYLVHKTIGIMEDFGIGNAAYSLKTLLTDGVLKKASTMRDPETGLNTTKEYTARGPVQAFTTSNNAWIIEDLQNRAIILILNATTEQTLAIHARQRRARTLEGMRDKRRWESDVRILQNAQRLLKPVAVLNPLADRLTFPSGAQRTRRDFDKYLTLIEAHALLNQFNRPVVQTEIDGEMVECISVTPEDIKRVNPIARHIFSASLDDLGPITRKLLELIREMVRSRCENEKIEIRDFVFSRRDVRENIKWSEDQVRRHMERLMQFEYVHSVLGRKGQLYLYRLDERQEESFNGLMDPDLIRNHDTDQDNDFSEAGA